MCIEHIIHGDSFIIKHSLFRKNIDYYQFFFKTFSFIFFSKLQVYTFLFLFHSYI